MFDPSIGRWLSEDPMGFDAGDSNLYRYVGNRATIETDPSGYLPSARRGTWIRGQPGNGVFRFGDTLLNRLRGVVGAEVRFVNNTIPQGGFPASRYWRGNSALSRVDIGRIDGTRADFTAADRLFRQRNPGIARRPPGFTWHHVGEPGSTILELVETGIHSTTSHDGPAAPFRAARRNGGAPPGVVNPAVRGSYVMTGLRVLGYVGMAYTAWQAYDEWNWPFEERIEREAAMYGITPRSWWLIRDSEPPWPMAINRFLGNMTDAFRTNNQQAIGGIEGLGLNSEDWTSVRSFVANHRLSRVSSPFLLQQIDVQIAKARQQESFLEAIEILGWVLENFADSVDLYTEYAQRIFNSLGPRR
ncbi:MAG: HNH endonuclease [Gemmataceae bacterium]|nr:HNH endonuclease [Gemmataceae bacterium]